ncbi:MAG: MoaD/ThiS family protein [Actinobacteria bacterium]|nr:MoaD/ThiS family protein [Actinomycetota bacterium]MCG2808272.1 MoaD/ThiS family protein [Coriobacteriia bacterium]
MHVDVALFASLSTFQPDGAGGRHARAFELDAGTTIAQVIETLALPDQPRVVFVNSRHAAEDSELHEGDRLAIFPPVAGG